MGLNACVAYCESVMELNACVAYCESDCKPGEYEKAGKHYEYVRLVLDNRAGDYWKIV